MTVRSQRFKSYVEALAARWPGAFVAVLVGLGVLALAAIAAAGAAALAGPIGVALREPFLGLSVSRLTVLQFGASVALVASIGVLALLAVWDGVANAPRLASATGRLICVVADVLKRADRSAPPWLFWAGAGAAVLWAGTAMLWGLPAVALVEPDTLGYLRPSPLRSSGYMLVLDAVAAATGGLQGIMPLQLAAMLASFVALGWAVKGVLGSPAAGLLVTLVLALNPGLLILAPAVMTEALFVALICFHLAAVLRALGRPSGVALIAAGVSLAAMVVLRPNGISFLVGVPLLLLFFPRHWRRVTLATLAPVAIAVLVQGAYHHQTFGFFGLHRFAGISLAGAAAPLIRADMPSEYPDLARELAQSLKIYARDFPPFEQRAYPFEMARVASLTAVGAIYKEILPAIRRKLDLPEPAVVAFEYDPRIEAIAGALARATIRNDPAGFAKIVTSNYIANWRATLPVRVPVAVYYPRGLDIARGVVAGHAALFSGYSDARRYWEGDLDNRVATVGRAGLRAIEIPNLAVRLFQPLLAAAAFVLSLWGLVAVFRRRSDPDGRSRALAYAAVVLQAGYAVISIGNASFTRYTVVFDPVVILVLVVGAALALRHVFAGTGAASTSP